MFTESGQTGSYLVVLDVCADTEDSFTVRQPPASLLLQQCPQIQS